MNNAPTTRAVLMTQVATAEALAATCAIHGVQATALPSEIGAYIPSDAATAERLATSLSSAITAVPFLLLSVADDRLSVHRYQDGERGEDVPGALVLDSLPADVENFLLGTVTIGDLAGGVDSGSIGRWKALRILARTSRALKAQAKGRTE
ncbi:hypothetical protein [Rarobacter incanus]|uniref:Uncharacterized protein n=1 Tax=Rarobacter incanus TaxID=153494 RepID=A0A542SLL8_9MICO|nr:hypothetical protein [Rarobacter incanus]TQK75512.1 hypothetical protein FB389_0139 [Rarobacter incanus]